MALNPAVLVHQHLRLRQPVQPGGQVLAVNIYAHDPPSLEAMHAPLCFLTSYRSCRTPNGFWVRVSGERPLNNHLGIPIGIVRMYKFVWKSGVQPRPNYRIREFRLSAKTMMRTIVIISPLVNEQQQQ